MTVEEEVLVALRAGHVLRYTPDSALAFLLGRVATLRRHEDGSWEVLEVVPVDEKKAA